MIIKTCYRCGAPSLLNHKDGLCHFHAKEEEQRREEARNRPLCRCGNMSRHNDHRCGKCIEKDHRREMEQEREEERKAEATELIRRVVKEEAKSYIQTIAKLQKDLKQERDENKRLKQELESALMGAYTSQRADSDWDQDVDWINCPHYDNYMGDD